MREISAIVYKEYIGLGKVNYYYICLNQNEKVSCFLQKDNGWRINLFVIAIGVIFMFI